MGRPSLKIPGHSSQARGPITRPSSVTRALAKSCCPAHVKRLAGEEIGDWQDCLDLCEDGITNTTLRGPPAPRSRACSAACQLLEGGAPIDPPVGLEQDPSQALTGRVVVVLAGADWRAHGGSGVRGAAQPVSGGWVT